MVTRLLPLMLLALGIAPALFAAELDRDAAWIERSNALMQQAREGRLQIDLAPAPDPQMMERQRAAASALERESTALIARTPVEAPLGAMSPIEPSPQPQPVQDAWYLFVSLSMPKEELRQSLTLSSAQPGLVVVFRGMRATQQYGDFVKELSSLMQGLDPPPQLQLDPVHFQKAHVQAAPLLVHYEHERETARVAGLTDPAWANRRIAEGDRGDLGTRGTLYPLIEIDLLAEMQQRLADYDWEGAKKRSVANYFASVELVELPRAQRDRDRAVDPTVEAVDDILGANGEVIIARGTKVNPLATVPFKQKLVIFDAADPRQVEFALTQREPVTQRRVTFIASHLDRAAGMEGLEQVMVKLQHTVSLLTPAIATRFALEHVPSTVEADGLSFKVREFALSANQEGRDDARDHAKAQ